jgi:superfamily II DNA/RNA helicase
MLLLSKPLGSAGPWEAPSHEEIHQKTFEAFGFYPCLWQTHVVEAILKHDHNVISIAATGSRKTLTVLNISKISNFLAIFSFD